MASYPQARTRAYYFELDEIGRMLIMRFYI